MIASTMTMMMMSRTVPMNAMGTGRLPPGWVPHRVPADSKAKRSERPATVKPRAERADVAPMGSVRLAFYALALVLGALIVYGAWQA
jgi:hypothetical protein